MYQDSTEGNYTFTFLDQATGQPVKIIGAMVFGDVDDEQSFTFKAEQLVSWTTKNPAIQHANSNGVTTLKALTNTKLTGLDDAPTGTAVVGFLGTNLNFVFKAPYGNANAELFGAAQSVAVRNITTKKIIQVPEEYKEKETRTRTVFGETPKEPPYEPMVDVPKEIQATPFTKTKPVKGDLKPLPKAPIKGDLKPIPKPPVKGELRQLSNTNVDLTLPTLGLRVSLDNVKFTQSIEVSKLETTVKDVKPEVTLDVLPNVLIETAKGTGVTEPAKPEITIETSKGPGLTQPAKPSLELPPVETPTPTPEPTQEQTELVKESPKPTEKELPKTNTESNSGLGFGIAAMSAAILAFFRRNKKSE